MTQLKPHNYYSFSEIQEALASIGKRELCEAFGFEWNNTTTFHLVEWEKNEIIGSYFDESQRAEDEINVKELIAALRSFGITEDEILVVSLD